MSPFCEFGHFARHTGQRRQPDVPSKKKVPDTFSFLKVIAKALDLAVAEEERKIEALTIRVAPTGHRLKATAAEKKVKLEEVSLLRHYQQFGAMAGLRV